MPKLVEARFLREVLNGEVTVVFRAFVTVATGLNDVFDVPPKLKILFVFEPFVKLGNDNVGISSEGDGRDPP
jgi:hypothetical protein